MQRTARLAACCAPDCRVPGCDRVAVCAVLERGLSDEQKQAERVAVRSSPDFATILDFLQASSLVTCDPVIIYSAAASLAGPAQPGC
jgi:hypothetical protein